MNSLSQLRSEVTKLIGLCKMYNCVSTMGEVHTMASEVNCRILFARTGTGQQPLFRQRQSVLLQTAHEGTDLSLLIRCLRARDNEIRTP